MGYEECREALNTALHAKNVLNSWANVNDYINRFSNEQRLTLSQTLSTSDFKRIPLEILLKLAPEEAERLISMGTYNNKDTPAIILTHFEALIDARPDLREAMAQKINNLLIAAQTDWKSVDMGGHPKLKALQQTINPQNLITETLAAIKTLSTAENPEAVKAAKPRVEGLIGSLPFNKRTKKELLDKKIYPPAFLRQLVEMGLWNDVRCLDEQENNLLHVLCRRKQWDDEYEYQTIVSVLSEKQRDSKRAFILAENESGKTPLEVLERHLTKNSSATDALLKSAYSTMKAQGKDLNQILPWHKAISIYHDLAMRRPLASHEWKSKFLLQAVSPGQRGGHETRGLVYRHYENLLKAHDSAFQTGKSDYQKSLYAEAAANVLKDLRAISGGMHLKPEVDFPLLHSYWQECKKEPQALLNESKWAQALTALTNLAPAERVRVVQALRLPDNLAGMEPAVFLELIKMQGFSRTQTNGNGNITGMVAANPNLQDKSVLNALTEGINQNLWMVNVNNGPSAFQRLATGKHWICLNSVLKKLPAALKQVAVDSIELTVEAAEILPITLRALLKNGLFGNKTTAEGKNIIRLRVDAKKLNGLLVTFLTTASYRNLWSAQDNSEGGYRTAFQHLAATSNGAAMFGVVSRLLEQHPMVNELLGSVGLPTIALPVVQSFTQLVTEGLFVEPLVGQETALERVVKRYNGSDDQRQFIQEVAANDRCAALVNNLEPILAYLEDNTQHALKILGLLGKDKAFVEGFKKEDGQPKYPILVALFAA